MGVFSKSVMHKKAGEPALTSLALHTRSSVDWLTEYITGRRIYNVGIWTHILESDQPGSLDDKILGCELVKARWIWLRAEEWYI